MQNIWEPGPRESLRKLLDFLFLLIATRRTLAKAEFLPQSLRRKIRLAVGGFVEIDIEDETLVIRPMKGMPPDQEHFFSLEWQQREAEADKDLAEGNVIGRFVDVSEALEALKGAKV